MRLEKSLAIKAAAIIAIGSWSVIGTMKLPNELDPSVSIKGTQSSTGRELFLNSCARCHGDDAKGDKAHRAESEGEQHATVHRQRMIGQTLEGLIVARSAQKTPLLTARLDKAHCQVLICGTGQC